MQQRASLQLGCHDGIQKYQNYYSIQKTSIYLQKILKNQYQNSLIHLRH